MEVNQTKSTRNQSTAQFTENCIFMGNNRFENGTISVAATTTIKDGMPVVRNVAKANAFSLATSANLADVVGVTKVGLFDVSLAASTDLNIAVCIKGDIDANGLVLPATVTLNTVVDTTKILRDVLNGVGLNVVNTTEQTKF